MNSRIKNSIIMDYSPEFPSLTLVDFPFNQEKLAEKVDSLQEEFLAEMERQYVEEMEKLFLSNNPEQIARDRLYIEAQFKSFFQTETLEDWHLTMIDTFLQQANFLEEGDFRIQILDEELYLSYSQGCEVVAIHCKIP